MPQPYTEHRRRLLPLVLYPTQTIEAGGKLRLALSNKRGEYRLGQRRPNRWRRKAEVLVRLKPEDRVWHPMHLREPAAEPAERVAGVRVSTLAIPIGRQQAGMDSHRH